MGSGPVATTGSSARNTQNPVIDSDRMPTHYLYQEESRSQIMQRLQGQCSSSSLRSLTAGEEPSMANGHGPAAAANAPNPRPVGELDLLFVGEKHPLGGRN